MKRITEPHRAFAAAIASGCSGAEACRRAGYSTRTARSIAYRLRRRPDVRAEVDRLARVRHDREQRLEAAIEAAASRGDVRALLEAFVARDKFGSAA